MTPGALDFLAGLVILIAAVGWDWCFRVWTKQ